MRITEFTDVEFPHSTLGAEWDRQLALLNQLHNIMIVVEKDHIAYINPIGAAKLGYDNPNSLIGLGFSTLFHDDYKDFAELGVDVLVAEESILSVKLCGLKGIELDAELWASTIEEDPSPIYMVEVHDITQHLKTAKELRIREKRLEGIINTVADGVITVDDAGIIQSFNPAAESIFGFKAAEIIGHNVRVLLPKPVVEDAAAVSGRELVDIMGTEGEATGKRKDGNIFPMEIAVRKLKTGDELTFTSIVRDISERKRLEERMAHLAHHDQLTGLPNRHVIMDRLEAGFNRALRHKASLAVLFIDLDKFKPINDTFGHAVGDEVLRVVADRLLTTVRKSDTVARVGGDEFIILLEDLNNIEDVELVAKNVLKILTKAMIIEGSNQTIGASIGIAIYPDHAASQQDLLERADQAMYAVKQSGRNSYRMYSSELKNCPGSEARNKPAEPTTPDQAVS